MPIGRLAKRPIKNEDNADIAAVETMRSFRTSLTQLRYSLSVVQVGSVVFVQTHVPPDCERMVALTEIYSSRDQYRAQKNMVVYARYMPLPP